MKLKDLMFESTYISGEFNNKWQNQINELDQVMRRVIDGSSSSVNPVDLDHANRQKAKKLISMATNEYVRKVQKALDPIKNNLS